jgi:hypothetical protein
MFNINRISGKQGGPMWTWFGWWWRHLVGTGHGNADSWKGHNFTTSGASSSVEKVPPNQRRRDQPHLQNTKICCGFFRNGFRSSDTGQYSGPLLWDVGITLRMSPGRLSTVMLVNVTFSTRILLQWSWLLSLMGSYKSWRRMEWSCGRQTTD